MPKYYYTDPLEAAYMCKKHNFIVENTNHHGLKIFTEWNDIFQDAICDNELEIEWLRKKYYINPNCYEMLKPQVGDLVTVRNDFVQYIAFIEKDGIAKCNSFPNTYLKSFEIIQIIERNGKAFFMPEIEEEND